MDGHTWRRLEQIATMGFLKNWPNSFSNFILLHKKFLQFDWLRAVVFQLNLRNYKPFREVV